MQSSSSSSNTRRMSSSSHQRMDYNPDGMNDVITEAAKAITQMQKIMSDAIIRSALQQACLINPPGIFLRKQGQDGIIYISEVLGNMLKNHADGGSFTFFHTNVVSTDNKLNDMCTGIKKVTGLSCWPDDNNSIHVALPNGVGVAASIPMAIPAARMNGYVDD